MYDTRTIMHKQRFFMSNNDLDPNIYEVTKIKDITPQGIIKLYTTIGGNIAVIIFAITITKTYTTDI